MQFELILIRKVLNMQLEIDSLKEQVNELKNENTRLKNVTSYQEIEKQNEIISSSEVSYSNVDQFIIDYISIWPEDILCKQICCAILYQDYLAWYKKNNEQVLSNNYLGKKFSQINIDHKQV